VVNEGGNNVSAYRLAPNGALTPVPGSPFVAGTDPHKAYATAKFVYVANEVSNNISAYRIGSNGALTPIPGSPFAGGIGPHAVAVDPTGKFVYVTNKGLPH
jgi:DNA-binding beta-propeller fold protein YncE